MNILGNLVSKIKFILYYRQTQKRMAKFFLLIKMKIKMVVIYHLIMILPLINFIRHGSFGITRGQTKMLKKLWNRRKSWKRNKVHPKSKRLTLSKNWATVNNLSHWVKSRLWKISSAITFTKNQLKICLEKSTCFSSDMVKCQCGSKALKEVFGLQKSEKKMISTECGKPFSWLWLASNLVNQMWLVSVYLCEPRNGWFKCGWKTPLTKKWRRWSQIVWDILCSSIQMPRPCTSRITKIRLKINRPWRMLWDTNLRRRKKKVPKLLEAMTRRLTSKDLHHGVALLPMTSILKMAKSAGKILAKITEDIANTLARWAIIATIEIFHNLRAETAIWKKKEAIQENIIEFWVLLSSKL